MKAKFRKTLSYSLPVIFISTGLAFAIQYKYYCPADIDRNGVVEFNDLTSLSAKYGEKCAFCREDINHDRVVDSTDMKIFMENYGKKVHRKKISSK